MSKWQYVSNIGFALWLVTYKLKSSERREFFDRFNIQQIQFPAFCVRLRLSHRLWHSSEEDSQTRAGHWRILVTPGIPCVGFCPADSGLTLCSSTPNVREIHIISSITQDWYNSRCLSVCLSFQNNSNSSEPIILQISGNVDNGPSKRWIHFGDVLDSGGTLSFSHPKAKETSIIQQPVTQPFINTAYILKV